VEHVQQRGVSKVSAEPVMLCPSFSTVARRTNGGSICRAALSNTTGALSFRPKPAMEAAGHCCRMLKTCGH